ncbi:MAG: hypothetical protein NT154_43495, partial [Verrucomicrobia bacterium]|nr:hypothetical protein [Verrucomicrobiota bacterium]
GSLARSLYIKLRVILAARTNGIKWSVFESYKVLAATEEGCRIQPTDSKGRKFGEVYIKGLKGITDKSYGMIYVRFMGDYSYKILLGDTKTIPEYEYGSQITQEEFTRKFKEQNS